MSPDSILGRLRGALQARAERVVNASIAGLPDPIARPIRRARVARRVRRGDRLVNEQALEDLYRRALAHLGPDPGDYLEFGVYVGTSLACMYRVSQRAGLQGMRLVGFDSFKGLPASARREDEGLWQPGSFDSDVEFAREHLRSQGVDLSRVVLIPGWFDETLTEGTRTAHGIERAGVVMVDCDLASSARAALEFAAPAIAGQAVLVFDDWHAGGLAEKDLGEKRAFDDFLSAHPEFHAAPFAEYPPYGVAFVLTRRTHEGDAERPPAGSA